MRVLAADTVGSPGVNITIFLIFVAITLVVVARASRNNRTAADYYAAGRAFTGPQNGMALAGDFLSADSAHIQMPARRRDHAARLPARKR